MEATSRIVWQKLWGKDKERFVDLDANRKTLLYLRKKMLVTVKDLSRRFNISESSARGRLTRLRNSDYLSAKQKGNKLVYFPTVKGFKQMPKIKKTNKPLIIQVTKEVSIETIKQTRFIGEA